MSLAKTEDEQKNGGCHGQDSMYVKLVSSDKHEFIIKREYALLSGTIKVLLEGYEYFIEKQNNVINLPKITSHILQKVCLYLVYKAHYSTKTCVIPVFPIDSKISLDLLMAADYLDV